MQNKGVLRTERKATAKRKASTAISQSWRERREKRNAKAAIPPQKKKAAWSQLSRAGFHSWICGRSQRTLPMSQRASSKPWGFNTTVPAAVTAEIQRAGMAESGVVEFSFKRFDAGTYLFKSTCAVVAAAAAKSRIRPASAPPCRLNQSANNGGNANAHGHFPE